MEEGQFTWGINAAALKSPWNRVPSVDDLLADREHTLVLKGFYRVGGEDRPATPTECRVAYNSDALFVLFRCRESDMSFPYDNLNTTWWPIVDWHSLHGLPSANNNWSPNPDEVDFLIQPDVGAPSYYQFAATPQDLRFGCERLLSFSTDMAADAAADARGSSESVSKVEGFEATVTRGADEWLVFFQIPWQTLGGKPKSQFGFLPVRTRWRDGEFSSPVAIDFNEGLPVDLLIETHFSGAAQVQDSQSSLCRLPYLTPDCAPNFRFRIRRTGMQPAAPSHRRPVKSEGRSESDPELIGRKILEFRAAKTLKIGIPDARVRIPVKWSGVGAKRRWLVSG